uniref:NTR domain-containing protein n=1 Tax=Panagrolaimus sp. PS1159 TaxID=55785 RepID=A0AC35GY69_9BILA
MDAKKFFFLLQCLFHVFLADWVAEITVLDTKYHEYFYEFNINYTTVFKMPSKFNETYPTKIFSHRQSSACGFELTHNIEFIVVGNINGEYEYSGPQGEIGTNYCSFLDTEFRQQLKNGTVIDCSRVKNEQK